MTVLFTRISDCRFQIEDCFSIYNPESEFCNQTTEIPLRLRIPAEMSAVAGKRMARKRKSFPRRAVEG